MEEKDLKPCPFCGGKAIYERLGTQRHSCIVICEDCGCTVESGETDWTCGRKWNSRDDSIIRAEAVAKYRERIGGELAERSVEMNIDGKRVMVLEIEMNELSALLTKCMEE